jgi:hypothetical protein
MIWLPRVSPFSSPRIIWTKPSGATGSPILPMENCSRTGLHQLAEQLRGRPGVKQAVAFGSMLHVSGDDAEALERAIAPFRASPYEWTRIGASLEDVFIHLMERSPDNFLA